MLTMTVPLQLKSIIYLLLAKTVKIVALQLIYGELTKFPELCLSLVFAHSTLSILLENKSVKEINRSLFRLPSISETGIVAIDSLLFSVSLYLCGPLRFLLLTEFTHTTLVTLRRTYESTDRIRHVSRTRGLLLLTIMIFIVFALDNDDPKMQNTNHTPSAKAHSMIHHLIAHAGISDHKIGVLCSIAYSISRSYVKPAVYTYSKRTLALMSIFSGTIIFVLYWNAVRLIGLGYACLFWIANGYCKLNEGTPFDKSSYKQRKLIISPSNYSMIFSIYPIILSLIITTTWMKPLQHPISLGVLVASVTFVIGVFFISKPLSTNRGHFVGYGAEGSPLFNLESGYVLYGQQSRLMSNIKSGIHKIFQNSDSRRIFYFLCLNLAFTFVEMVYGVWTNSLGLLSDGFHMLFDCSALVMGLYASVMSKWKPTHSFTYGYGRVEVLSGFINGLFLCVIALFVMFEAFFRLYSKPEVKTERLLLVSVAGLIVNLIGIFSFTHNHSHGACHGHSHEVKRPVSLNEQKHHHHHHEAHTHAESEHSSPYEIQIGQLPSDNVNCVEHEQNDSIPINHSQYHCYGATNDLQNRASNNYLNHCHHSLKSTNDRALHSSAHQINVDHFQKAIECHRKLNSHCKSFFPNAHCEHQHHPHSNNVTEFSEHYHDHHHDHHHHHHTSALDSANMRGVFLHVLADTLGSVGVIISSILIDKFGWHIADPICSLFISFTILGSVISLLKSSAHTLLLRVPIEFEADFNKALNEIAQMKTVRSIEKAALWAQSSNEHVCLIKLIVYGNGQQTGQIVESIIKNHIFSNNLDISIHLTFFHSQQC